MFCGNCGLELEEGVKFCPDCGMPVEDTVKDTVKEVKGRPLRSKGLAVAGFALSLAGVLFSWLGILFVIIFWPLGLFFLLIPVAGIVFSALGIRTEYKGLAIAGLIISIIVTAVLAFLFLIFVVSMSALAFELGTSLFDALNKIQSSTPNIQDFFNQLQPYMS